MQKARAHPARLAHDPIRAEGEGKTNEQTQKIRQKRTSESNVQNPKRTPPRTLPRGKRTPPPPPPTLTQRAESLTLSSRTGRPTLRQLPPHWGLYTRPGLARRRAPPPPPPRKGGGAAAPAPPCLARPLQGQHDLADLEAWLATWSIAGFQHLI